MVHGYLPGTILSARELTGPAAWFALEGRAGFHGTDNPVAFFNQFFARHGADVIGTSLRVDNFSPLSSQNMRHLNHLPVISGLFHPPLLARPDTASHRPCGRPGAHRVSGEGDGAGLVVHGGRLGDEPLSSALEPGAVLPAVVGLQGWGCGMAGVSVEGSHRTGGRKAALLN
jgi:hypothetical protein